MSIKNGLLAATAVLTLLSGPVAVIATAGQASAAVTAQDCKKCSSYTPKKVTAPGNVVSTPRPQRSVSVPTSVGSTPRASRSVSAPTGVGGATSSHRAARSVSAPVNTGSLVVGSVARTAPAANRAVTVPTTRVRVSGSTASFGGVKYAYHSPDTYRGHPLPRRGTHAYYEYYNDPFIYSNYFSPLSPWHTYYLRYHTFYVTGYVVQDGYFVPVSHGPSTGVVVGIIAAIVVVLLLIWLATALARRSRRSSGPRRPADDVQVGGGWRQ